jgi:hypothetical protein
MWSRDSTRSTLRLHHQAVIPSFSLLSVRNSIAHGPGISDSYAQELLAHWGPKVAAVLAYLDRLTEIELWTRDPDGCKRLNGAHADRETRTEKSYRKRA